MRRKMFITLLAVMMIAVMLTGCLAVEMKVNSNGSCDITYTIDTSQLNGMMTKKDLEEAIKESVKNMNDTAGKNIAKLKGIKEDKKKETMTATISVSDINKMGDGAFYGTVKEYRKKDGAGLDNMVTKKDKDVEAKKISDSLQMVYLPMSGSDEYGLIEVTVIVPGNIEYLTDGGDVKKNNTAVFNGGTPLVIFKKGGGFPIWLLIILAIAIAAFAMKKKTPAATTASVAPVAPVTPPSAPFPAQMATTEMIPEEPVVEDAPEAADEVQSSEEPKE